MWLPLQAVKGGGRTQIQHILKASLCLESRVKHGNFSFSMQACCGCRKSESEILKNIQGCISIYTSLQGLGCRVQVATADHFGGRNFCTTLQPESIAIKIVGLHSFHSTFLRLERCGVIVSSK